MTVKELINILKDFDEDMEVLVTDNHWDEPIGDVDEYDGVVIIRA